eukprot:Em0001g3216a
MLSGSHSDDEDILHIEIHRDGTGFGFSIRGGAEYNAPLCVLRMAPEGAAERDGRLRVGDELLEINGNSTEGMGHADAITIIKHGGDIVKLTVRRLPESLSGRMSAVARGDLVFVWELVAWTEQCGVKTPLTCASH